MRQIDTKTWEKSLKIRLYMKYLGIDYGTKRIGIATSNDDGTMAFPKSVLDNDNKIIQNLGGLIKENDIKTIVLGESKNYKMEDNEIMEDIYDLKKIIESQFEVDVVFHPEVLTSMEAAQIQGRNDMLDASAATIILQNYLDLINNK